MKFSRKIALLSIVMAGSIGMTGCKSNAKMPVNFVAVTSSSYNAEVQFGDYDYKFQGKINQGSSTFTLYGNVAQRHLTASSGGGMGGFPGGGFPGGGPGGNSSGPAFEGFGAGEQQQGGEQPGGEQPGGQQQGGENPFGGGENPFGGNEQPGGQEQGQGEQQGNENPFGGNEQGQGEQQGGNDNPFGGNDNPFGGNGEPGGQEPAQEIAPTSLTLSLDKAEAFINQTVTATVAVEPENASKTVTWTSSDEEIATVNNGSITPVGEGTVTITATSTVDETKKASAELKVVKEDLTQYNWSMSGSLSYEKGYGYKIVFNDEGHTEVHTDFDRTEGRHEFYYRVTIGEESQVLKFQAKDPTFKDQLAKDYKKWDERDAQYIFYAKATGNNNSVATAYMYLHKTNNEVTVNTPNGANRSLSFGMKWEDRNGQIVVKDGETEYIADKSVANAEHEGYRLIYSGNTYYCSLNPEVKWKKLTTADFEGANTHEFVGSYTTSGPDGGVKEVNLNCVEDGKAKLYLGSSTPSFVGTWTEADNKLTINLDGKTGEFVKEDGKYNVVIRVTISSFFGSSTETIALTQNK